MDPYQESRLAKAYAERFFVLDFIAVDDSPKYEIKVAGTKMDVYTVTIISRGTLRCDCPDGKSHALKRGVWCKHICFVVFRCGNIPRTVLDTRKLDEEQLKELPSKFVFVMNNAGLSSEELSRKYKNASLQVNPSPRNAMESCVICFEDLAGNELRTCGVCLNAVHGVCFERWKISARKTECLFCRTRLTMTGTGGSYVNLQ